MITYKKSTADISENVQIKMPSYSLDFTDYMRKAEKIMDVWKIVTMNIASLFKHVRNILCNTSTNTMLAHLNMSEK